MSEDLRARALRWIAEDPDTRTQAELRALLEGDITATDLADRFAGALEFGTAGLRGVLGAGPNRMNRAVVLRTTLGFARYLAAHSKDPQKNGVVIGYDGRRMSRELAEDTAAVLAGQGIRAHLFTDFAPTPLTAFAVTHLGAAAGVMITASHNPPEYNGYKAYWTNGAQIVPPVDEGIAAEIAKAPPARDVPRVSLADARARGLVVDVPPSVERAYLDAVRALEISTVGDRSMTIVYTPLHGVGAKLTQQAFAEAGFTGMVIVPEQERPDGAFPTVAFPNPEEKGSMDLSFKLGRKTKAALILANDPDADRLAVAVPFAASPSGYMQLTGNQVGVLLGHYLLTESPVAVAKKGRCAALASIVSSPMLGFIARALGVHYEETLTGFKWIANRAMELERDENLTFLFGYEEALGYTVGDLVRDKDGISAAVVVAEMVAALGARGVSVLDELESLYRKYGLFVSSQVNITKKGERGTAEIRALMSHLRAEAPTKIGAHDVVGVRDYETRTRTDMATGKVTPLTLPKSNVLTFELAGGSRVIARPSGTEPKVKFYFDVREEMAPGESLATVEARAGLTIQSLAEAFVKITEP